MISAALVLTLALFAADDAPTRARGRRTPRKNPNTVRMRRVCAYLTKDEEDKLDEIVDRFMQYDIGRLPGKEAAQRSRRSRISVPNPSQRCSRPQSGGNDRA